MNTSTWIGRGVTKFLPAAKGMVGSKDTSNSQSEVDVLKGSHVASQAKGQRSCAERMEATFSLKTEAMSPRMLRRTYELLKSIIDPRVSEVEGGRRAEAFAALYKDATTGRRRDVWLLMSEMFVADQKKVKEAQARFSAAFGTADEAVAEVHFRRETVSPRRRLLQRFSVYPEGVQFLVDLRAELQAALKTDKRLQALDVEMEYMFSTWFDVGFLELRRMSWNSPASLIEKLIQYEAVHDIKSWADVKNRLDSDRRCYGFFHPRLPEIPLIFVEVALVDEIASDIVPLLDELGADADLQKATTAIFYSISNTQVGLRGVSFGDSLIKAVVEKLKKEFPRLKVFATLSPIPGYRTWLEKNIATLLEKLEPKERQALGRAVGFEPPAATHFLSALDAPLQLSEKSLVRHYLMRFAAEYLGRLNAKGHPTDPVARFHLGNGARVDRLNWAGDPSPKGVKQSYGLMVNYLYDLKRLDKNRALLADGAVPVSSGIEDLMLKS